MSCETEQYDRICKDEFQKINDRLDKIFIDNGNESFQSKLNRHEQFIRDYNDHYEEKESKWLTYIPMFVGILLVASDFIFRFLTGK
jgi:hypothetical protein